MKKSILIISMFAMLASCSSTVSDSTLNQASEWSQKITTEVNSELEIQAEQPRLATWTSSKTSSSPAASLPIK